MFMANCLQASFTHRMPARTTWLGGSVVPLRIGLAAVLLLLAFAAEARGQAKAFFQNATSVVAQDSRVNLNRVTVRDSTGAFKYYDIALVYNVAANGTLTLNTTASKITPSPALLVGSFKPGIYRSSLGGRLCDYELGAPGSAGGARVVASLADIGQFACPLLNVSWVTGPISGHPNQQMLAEAGITFQGYSWGAVGEVGSTFSQLGWAPGDIVGAAQAGNLLVIHRYGDDSRLDSSVSFTFCPDC